MYTTHTHMLTRSYTSTCVHTHTHTHTHSHSHANQLCMSGWLAGRMHGCMAACGTISQINEVATPHFHEFFPCLGVVKVLLWSQTWSVSLSLALSIYLSHSPTHSLWPQLWEPAMLSQYPNTLIAKHMTPQCVCLHLATATTTDGQTYVTSTTVARERNPYRNTSSFITVKVYFLVV